LAEVVAAGKTGQPFFFQLYVNSDRSKTEALLRSAKELGVKALQVTVDAPIPGKREADERIAAENLVSAVSGAVASNDKKGGGLGRVMAKYIDPTLCWEYGAAAILLSNHGGRSLDTTQPAMLTLLELHNYSPEVFDHIEVYVDGGFTRGTDIIKALALGATAVGLGRPFLYALAYGQDGVEHLIEILKDEIECTMKLAGITDVDEAHPGMVNTAMLEPLVRGEAHPWIQWKPRASL
jgi:L-lactate dehydrogenase (cytochrome)